MTKQQSLRVLLYLLVLFSIRCQTIPHIVEDSSGIDDVTIDRNASAPIVIVGQIIAYKEIGRPKPSRFDKNTPIQLCRITVRLENVLRGNIGSVEVPIYFLVNIGSNGGPLRLGMLGRSGTWRIGDRNVFALRWNSGVLRTMRDTYPAGVEKVLTGPHPDYSPRPGESVAQMIIDILLSRGRGCSDRQMADAVRQFRAYDYDLAYSVQKLRRLAAEKTPEVRSAAQEKLDELALSWPQIRTGWPESATVAPANKK